MAFAADARGLDKSAVIGEQSIWIQQQLYASLYAPALEGREVEPHLAESHSLSDDQLEWTITLREGLRFSDGSPLVAEDVKFSLEESRDQGGTLAFLYRAIADVEAVDERTVVIRTEVPFAPMLAVLSERSAGVVPNEYGGRTRDEFYEAPVSSGPFVLEQWKRGEELVLVRNEYYHEPAELERVTFKVVSDDNARLLQLQDGQFELMGNVPFTNASNLDTVEGLALRTFPWTNVDLIVMNHGFEPFGDAQVRRAMSLAIDREAIADGIFSSYAEPAYSFIASSLIDSQPKDAVTHDLEAAREALAASGYPDGFTFHLQYPGTTQTTAAVVQAVQEQLAAIGIELVPQPLEPAAAQESWFTGNYEATYNGLSSDIPDPDFMATAFVATAGLFAGYESDEVTALSAEAASTFDEADRQALYTQMVEAIMSDTAVLPLIQQENLYVVDEKVSGFDVAIQGQFFMKRVGVR